MVSEGLRVIKVLVPRRELSGCGTELACSGCQ